MLEHNITVAAGQTRHISARGRVVYVESSTGPLKIRSNSGVINVTLKQGQGANEGDEYFSSLEVVNEGAASVTASVIVSSVEFIDKRIVGEVDANTLSGSVIASSADVLCTAAAVTQVVTASAGRKEIIISSLSTNAQTMRVGDVGAGATNGLPVSPGASVVLTTSAAVYVYNPAGADGYLAIMEVSQ
jgi:acyl-coenzyme A thioesterase PaaI-like protein